MEAFLILNGTEIDAPVDDQEHLISNSRLAGSGASIWSTGFVNTSNARVIAVVQRH
jgi:hypothetical protein